MIAYIGYRIDPTNHSRFLYTTRIEDRVDAKMREDLRFDYVSAIVNTSGKSQFKNRYKSYNIHQLTLPYRTIENGVLVEKHIVANGKKHEAIHSLVSWILEQQIDFNHIKAIDEFTLKMLAEL